MGIKVGIVSDHKIGNSIVVDGHNKRKFKNHKSNIDTRKLHKNYHQATANCDEVLDECRAKYIERVMSSNKSKKQKKDLIEKNEKRIAKNGIHSFVFQIGGTDQKDDEINFNEYFKKCFRPEDKLEILKAFGEEFEKWVENYSEEFGTSVKLKSTLVDFSIHMDETTPHLHMSFVNFKENGFICNGNMSGKFNYRMNQFAKKRLIELTHDFAQKEISKGLINLPNNMKLRELKKIEAKNTKAELEKELEQRLSTDEHNVIREAAIEKIKQDLIKDITPEELDVLRTKAISEDLRELQSWDMDGFDSVILDMLKKRGIVNTKDKTVYPKAFLDIIASQSKEWLMEHMMIDTPKFDNAPRFKNEREPEVNVEYHRDSNVNM